MPLPPAPPTVIPQNRYTATPPINSTHAIRRVEQLNKDASETQLNPNASRTARKAFTVNLSVEGQEKAAADQDQVESVRSKPAEDTPQSPAAPAPSPLSTQQPSSLINIIA